MCAVVLIDLNGDVFYEGEDDLHEISDAVENYLSGLTNEEIQEHYGFNLKSEMINCKNEALTSVDSYTYEDATKVSMEEFDKLGVHHDSFTRRMSEFYYEISYNFS